MLNVHVSARYGDLQRHSSALGVRRPSVATSGSTFARPILAFAVAIGMAAVTGCARSVPTDSAAVVPAAPPSAIAESPANPPDPYPQVLAPTHLPEPGYPPPPAATQVATPTRDPAPWD